MTVSATNVQFDEHTMSVDLSDGRTLRVPLAWFPRLLQATPAERNRFELSRTGLHWEKLDEDISVAGLLAGRGDITKSTDSATMAKRAISEASGKTGYAAAKKLGLDGRHRDTTGQIHHKQGNTRVGALRKTYGEQFAAGRRSDMKLENLLRETGAKSLTDFRKNYNK
jgi:Protein of unknown function (DUF2442)